MNRGKTIVWSASIGAAVGAGIMYMMDPDRGHRRQALARERGGSVLRRASRKVSKLASDVQNRTRGLLAQVRHSHEPVDDDVLISRVRTRLGRLVEHPHQVDVIARGGVVVLSGIVGRTEFDRL